LALPYRKIWRFGILFPYLYDKQTQTFMKEEIHNICKRYDIKNYTINDDGSIDVDGVFYLSSKGLEKLPVKIRKVTGDFYCHNNELTSLEGCPKTVGGHFYCHNNELTSLEGCPKTVGGDFECGNNNLTSLKGGPDRISGSFYCYENNLPKHIVDNPKAELQRIHRNNKLNIILG